MDFFDNMKELEMLFEDDDTIYEMGNIVSEIKNMMFMIYWQEFRD